MPGIDAKRRGDSLIDVIGPIPAQTARLRQSAAKCEHISFSFWQWCSHVDRHSQKITKATKSFGPVDLRFLCFLLLKWLKGSPSDSPEGFRG
ncbi:MAG: hypothetical protein QOG67_3625 [Verrucomicrobiota bacterium]